LEFVHPVVRRGGDGAGGVAGDLVVPRGPSEARARHDGDIGVERGGVGLVVERAEEAALGIGGRGEEPERLVAVAGEDDFIKRLAAARGGRDRDAAGRANDTRGGGVEADAVGEGRGERGDVALGTVFHGPPLVLGVEAEEAVVVKKPE
jgi:hypothetical protein